MTTKTIRIGSMALTAEEARRAGLLPEQRNRRHARSASLLRQIGLGDTPEALALRRAAAHSRASK